VTATPWDDDRTKGRRREGYSILRGKRQELLQAAWSRGASPLELWEAAHSTEEDTPGWWWKDPEYRITSMGYRETPCPPHAWANLMYWLQHGRMWRPDGSIPFEEGSVSPWSLPIFSEGGSADV
jgi:hypothetical protein